MVFTTVFNNLQRKGQQMKVQKKTIVTGLLILALALSIVSAQTNIIQTQELPQNIEAQAVGGISCAGAWGLAIGLGVAALSPCGIVCATGAWYSLLLLNEC